MNTSFVRGQQQSPLSIQAVLPHVVITGDLQLVVTESDVARGPIIGSYSIETQGMQKSLQVCWGGEGQVRDRRARTTGIAFEMPGFRVGQMWIYSVQAQVTDRLCLPMRTLSSRSNISPMNRCYPLHIRRETPPIKDELLKNKAQQQQQQGGYYS